mmetsp:Transcript_15000/g.30909  ORF Transcript_15000/g.30909 Transcript_15000/m.30909 type:complete len:172 (+) Transcript_15000:268-783(+)
MNEKDLLAVMMYVGSMEGAGEKQKTTTSAQPPAVGSVTATAREEATAITTVSAQEPPVSVTATSINSFFVFSTYFYLSLGRGSIISTPNQLFSTSDLENFTNRPGDNLENLYPTSHGPFLPNFLQITPTASRSLSTKLISTPNFTHYLLLLTAIKINQKRIEPVVTLLLTT